jgi:putative nucleotidyltransferase with HDIG domain
MIGPHKRRHLTVETGGGTLKIPAICVDQGEVERRNVVTGTQLAIFAAALSAVVLTSRSSDWHPIGLFVLLAALALASHALAINAKGLRLSGSFLVLVLAMAFLGPAPAATLGVLTMLFAAAQRMPALPLFLNNLATYATFPLVGGLLIRWATSHSLAEDDAVFALIVLGVYTVTMTLNFVLTAMPLAYLNGLSVRSLVRTGFLPVLPSEAVAATLVLVFALIYRGSGFPALCMLAVALFAFQWLTRALLQSEERAEQLSVQTTQLASLQVGVLAALVQTLSLRDKMTARHSAAVARYSRAIATEIGCSPEMQELVHTAGLLHDIGKFIFPDRILFADARLTDEDWLIVKKHPAQGARVVGRVSGYGPVAEIIRSHHERIDGKGYPDGLDGPDIPLLSRMISIADTYDVMTARDSYRKPVPPEEAVAELRRVSGTQLDGTLVEVFIKILDERALSFQHTTDRDFERELAFDGRVRAFLEKSAA